MSEGGVAVASAGRQMETEIKAERMTERTVVLRKARGNKKGNLIYIGEAFPGSS